MANFRKFKIFERRKWRKSYANEATKFESFNLPRETKLSKLNKIDNWEKIENPEKIENRDKMDKQKIGTKLKIPKE